MIIAFASALFTPTGCFNVNYCVPDTPGSTPRPNVVTINGVDHTDAVLRLYKTSLGFGLKKLRNEARVLIPAEI
jgi:hypothetical protein